MLSKEKTKNKVLNTYRSWQDDRIKLQGLSLSVLVFLKEHGHSFTISELFDFRDNWKDVYMTQTQTYIDQRLGELISIWSQE